MRLSSLNVRSIPSPYREVLEREVENLKKRDAGADSDVGFVRVVSSSLVFLGIACVVLVALIVFAASRHVGRVNEHLVPPS